MTVSHPLLYSSICTKSTKKFAFLVFFGSIAGRISAGSDSFTITVWAVSNSDPVGGHESYNLVFARLVPTVTFDSMLHNVSLTYIYNAIARKRVYTDCVTLLISWSIVLLPVDTHAQCHVQTHRVFVFGELQHVPQLEFVFALLRWL